MCYDMTRNIRAKRKAVEYLGGKCSVCGSVYELEVYEFHHRDPNTKSFSIGHVRHIANISWERLRKELDKCDLVCSNCHRVISTHSARHAKCLAEVNKT
jgi:predicted HNH restriction endonuclease